MVVWRIYKSGDAMACHGMPAGSSRVGHGQDGTFCRIEIGDPRSQILGGIPDPNSGWDYIVDRYRLILSKSHKSQQTVRELGCEG